MTDGFDQALVDAGIAPLQANPALAVYPGGVPNQDPPIVPPYVVVYSYVDWPPGAPGDALDGLTGSPTVNWTIHCVAGGKGATPATAEKAARAIGQQVRTSLLNQRPVVAGLDLGLVRYVPDGAVPQIDYATGAPIADLIVKYRLEANT